MWVWSLRWEDPLEEGMGTHSSILAWRIPWTEEPGGLQSMGSQRVRHDWSNLACTNAQAALEHKAKPAIHTLHYNSYCPIELDWKNIASPHPRGPFKIILDTGPWLSCNSRWRLESPPRLQHEQSGGQPPWRAKSSPFFCRALAVTFLASIINWLSSPISSSSSAAIFPCCAWE